MERVLILGSKGTLGGRLMDLYPGAVGWDRDDIDVLDWCSLGARIAALGFLPEAVINCIAFNDVDGAEERPEQANALNGVYPGKLAALTRRMNVPLVHYSTNYVFDGAAGEYAEDATPNPLSAYARSKLRGEQLVAENGGQFYIVRTSVIFGPKGASDLSKKSFVDLMLDLALRRDTLQVVSDEINSLTYAPDLAGATHGLLETLPPAGIYHATNSGGASWYEFACEIFRLAGRNVTVVPVASTQFPRKAARPPKAVLVNTKLPPLRPWQEALEEFLGRR